MESQTQQQLLNHHNKQRCTYKSKKKITLIVLSFAMSSFYFGYCNVYFGQISINVVLELLNFDMDPNVAKGLLNGAMPAGALFGAMGSSLLLKKFSRRQCLLIVNFFGMIVGGMLYIQNFYCFLICRICQGYVVGTYSVLTPLIIRQLAPVQISGTLGSYTQLSLCSGVVFACLLSYILKKITGDQSGKQFWFIIYGFTQLTLIAQTAILLFVFPYETPKYLLSKGKQAQARDLIAIIYKEQYVDEILEEKKADIKSIQVEQVKKNEEESIISQSQLFSSTNNIKKATLPLIAALHLSALQQFSGVNAISIYAGDIAAKSVSKQLSMLIPTLINSEQIIGGLITGILLMKFGRKTLLQYGTFIAAMAHIMVGLGFFFKYTLDEETAGQVFVLIGLVIFMAAYSFSLGPIIWLYIPEIIDVKQVPSALVMHWVTYFIVVFLFPIITENVLNENPTLIFIFLGVYLLVSVVVNAKVMVETKGKTERMIQKEYKQLKVC